MTRDPLVVQKISLLEITSAVVLLANVVVVVVDLLESSMLLTQATLQVTHRCTHAPYGTLQQHPGQCDGNSTVTAQQIAHFLTNTRLTRKDTIHHHDFVGTTHRDICLKLLFQLLFPSSTT